MVSDIDNANQNIRQVNGTCDMSNALEDSLLKTETHELTESKSSILEPQSSFLEPKSSFLEPQSSFLELQSSFLEPKSSLLEPKSSLLEPKSSLLDTQTSVLEQELSLSSQHPALSKYRDLQKIGSGSQGTMLRGRDENGEWVAIKVFDIQTTDSFKSMELFEREIITLKNLHISGIPKYIDTIKSSHCIYLIEEYIQAPSMEKRITDGQKYTFDQIVKILLNAAKILKYLGDLIPPVIHRDINPSNLLVDDNENVYLVDFGVVAGKPDPSVVLTYAGTAGYTAPEVIYGKATLASDVFSLGMSILYLITHVSPCQMLNQDMEIELERYIPSNIPDWFVRMLKNMIAHKISQRLKNGDEIIRCIEVG